MKSLRIIIITLFFIGLAARGFAFDFDFDKQMRDLKSLAGNSLSSGVSALQGAGSYFNKSLFAYTPFGLASSAASYFGSALTSSKITFPTLPSLNISSLNSLGSYLNKNLYPYTPFGLAGSTASYFGNVLTNYKITLPAIPKLSLPSFNSLGSSFDTALRFTNTSVNIIRIIPAAVNPLNAPFLLATQTFKQFLPSTIQALRDFNHIDFSRVNFNSMYISTQDAFHKLSTIGINMNSSIDWSRMAGNLKSVGENLVFHQANFLNLHHNYALERFRSNYLQ